ncbi:DUF3311 domain-containing protein [Bacillus sp. MM2020_1]|nr:DUF3311 domain-containing protein [Bacillus sp. MM2020_1]
MKKICVLLSVIPFIGSLTVMNRVEPYILGLPFIIFWSAAWLILSAVCMGISNLLYPIEEDGEEV